MKTTTIYTDCIAGIAEIHRKLNDLAYNECECAYQLQRHDGYPKNLILPLSLLPFTLAELNGRLFTLTAFGIDIFVLHNGESMRLWKHGQGYDTHGLDYIIRLRREHYLRQQQERTLKEGDRVALLGRGIALVERVDKKQAVVRLGTRMALKIPLNDIVINQRNLRWECAANSLQQ